MTPQQIKNFIAKIVVDVETGCWVFRTLDSTGYGYFTIWPKKCLAHRVAYEWLVGPIPDGLQVDHLCRNRACVNPDHLEAVTCKENLLRGETFNHYNSLKTHCPQGHPYDWRNTSFKKNGSRVCKACARIRARRNAARRKAEREQAA